MSIDVHFDDWDRIEQDYMAWWAHELDRPLVLITERVPDAEGNLPEIEHFTSNYPLEMPGDEVIAQITRLIESQRYHGDAYPRWWVNFGPGIMAGFLGAKVHSVPDTVWFEPQEIVPPEELHFSYDPDNVWWRRVQDLTQTALDAWEGQVQVSHTDLGGNLDILASFRTTERLLFDLYDAPEEIDRLTREITELWIRYYREQDEMIRPVCGGTSPWAPVWSTQKTYMLQSDFAYMISPEMFERYVVPDLVACCDFLDHGFYHLDGPGQIPHLDMLIGIERLRGIQWVPGAGNPSPDQWLDLLKRIIDGGKLSQLFVTAEGAMHIVRNIGGKGFLLQIADEMSADEAEAFLKELARQDISRQD
jgi:5-methyltetrahydrofolate--homocysteine methyltransferase